MKMTILVIEAATVLNGGRQSLRGQIFETHIKPKEKIPVTASLRLSVIRRRQIYFSEPSLLMISGEWGTLLLLGQASI